MLRNNKSLYHQINKKLKKTARDKTEGQLLKSLGCSKRCSKGSTSRNKKNLKQTNFIPKEARKKKRNKAQSPRRKELIKITAEINETQKKGRSKN